MMLQEVARTLLAEATDVTVLQRGDSVIDPDLRGVVLFDEADRMAPGALAALAARDDLAVILAALPGFADRLPALPGIKVVRLAPLNAAETAELVAVHLRQGGHAPDLLTPAAVDELFRRSGGIPRVLHTLLGLAIFAASLGGASHVTPAHVAEAVLFRDGEDAQQPPGPASREAAPVTAPAAPPVAAHSPASASRRRRRTWAIAAAVLLCLGGAAALLSPEASVPSPPGAAVMPAQTDQTSTNPPVPPIVPAAPAEAGRGVLLPSGSLIRVVLSYPMGNADAARRGGDLARHLRTEGVTVGEPVPVLPPVTVSALLYYFAQDRDGAAAIGRKLDGQFGEPVLARLPPRSPLPRPGTIEVVLAAVAL